MWNVNLWCDNPSSGEDSCTTGFDFKSEQEARAFYEQPFMEGAGLALANMPEDTDTVQKQWAARALLGNPYLELACGDVRIASRCWSEDVLKKLLEEREWDRQQAARDARKESAMMAGMAWGARAYNDYMGWGEEAGDGEA